MAKRLADVLQFSEPPPLPPNNDRNRIRLVHVAIAVSTALVPLLMLLFLKPPIDLGTQFDGAGKGSSGASKQNGTGTSDGDQSGGSASITSGNGTGADSSDLATSSTGFDQQIAPKNDLNARPTTVDKNVGELNAVQSDIPAGKVKSESLSQSDATESSKGNQFFTLRNPLDHATGDELRTESVSKNDAFSGRSPGRKEGMLRAQGGTAATEAAVKLGLEWLAKNQQGNGSWSLSGPYKDGSGSESDAAATAMALLALQGAGHTHEGDADDKFTRVVARGSSALLKRVTGNQSAKEEFTQGGGYTQAMCTMAICELYGMTHDGKLRKPAFQAVQYCLDAQSDQGGWRYTPRADTDTSITGWFVMGLQSGRMAGLKVPKQAFNRVSSYLDIAANKSGSGYGYQPGVAAIPSMTAEALLCRQYLGWNRDDVRLQNGAKSLLAHPPEWKSVSRDVYYMYYATQVCHHMGGDYWQKWNAVMREQIPSNQIKDGKESGSWDPRGDKWGPQGGRLYVTCMCLYMLEVYYRYLPLYQESAVAHQN